MLIRSKRLLTLAVLLPLLAVAGQAPPPTGTVGVFYTYTLPQFGTLPDSYTVTGGSLPPGLTLGLNTGVISGTPLGYGVYNFTVSVSDSSSQPSGSAPGGEASRYTRGIANAFIGTFSYTITINPGGPAGAPMSPAALALLMLGLAAAGIFRVRQVRQS